MSSHMRGGESRVQGSSPGPDCSGRVPSLWFASGPNMLVRLEEGNLEITLLFEMDTKFNYIARLPERRMVRPDSPQTFVVPGRSGADSGSGSGSAFCQMQSWCWGSYSACDSATVDSSVSV